MEQLSIVDDSYCMDDFDGLVVTAARELKHRELHLSNDELLGIAISLAQKLTKQGYSKGRSSYVNHYDERWRKKIYELSFHESPAQEKPLQTPMASPARVDFFDEFEAKEELQRFDDIALEGLEITDDVEPSPEEQIDAPSAPKVRLPERAPRKTLDPEAAREKAPSWAK